jgi:PAS domain S-box-containing protein
VRRRRLPRVPAARRRRAAPPPATAWLRHVATESAAFRRLYDAVACGVLVRDHSGVIVDANAAALRILGRPLEAIQGRLWTSALLDARREDGSPLPDVERPLTIAIRTGRPVRGVTLSIGRPDGERRWVVVDTVPLCGPDGEPQQIVTSFVDVTEHRHAEAERERLLARERAALEEAQEALRVRDEFLSIASHELRTPLTGLKGNTQLLLHLQQHGALDPQRLTRALQRIDLTVNRLVTLVTDLLDVSRIRAGRLQLTTRPTDLSALVQLAAAPYREQEGARHTLSVELPQASYKVLADATRVEQVLTNLLDNAVKYSPRGGAIRIVLQADPESVTVRVQDTGIGLPPEASATIFEPFDRGPNAAAQRIPGLGLGLYICREIVQAHGGRIWVESPGPGQGSTFAFTLPRRPPDHS